MDLRDHFNDWTCYKESGFILRRPLNKTGCPCNRVPRALWRVREHITATMEQEGHELHFNPRYELGQDGIGIRCHKCALLVRGFVGRISSDEIMLHFETPVVPSCEECLADIPY